MRGPSHVPASPCPEHRSPFALVAYHNEVRLESTNLEISQLYQERGRIAT
jgi:hypothetical protein